MTRIFSILFAVLTLSSGVALAYSVQDDAICNTLGHTGYIYDGPNDSPELPLNPSEEGLENVGQFGSNFTCSSNPPATCHWAYIPASGGEEARWVQCRGNIVRNS